MKTSGYIREVQGEGVIISLHVQPRASVTSFAGVFGEALKLKVKSPPVDGAANEECRRFLASLFKVGRSDVKLKAGAGSRDKIFLIKGISLDDALTRLAG
ncbi:MAG: DUF167 domain-containing protein [Dissulfurimicrobium sp.]|uniref:DUF167 domain-containing protein n=1 Tax=Dissulfurimicrobium TaxID=1769732 RepID=UPI001EDA8A5E|nr:DUF167 domain-containing protein [Dissulfurimicrobium hydrothermale]UKL14181.1 DUF167 domain-containing protein [Dissulfurimicrobium hydrothermale]